MYMANASPNARGPNATYIPSAHIGLALGLWKLALSQGGFALGGIRVESARLFRYQYVGIGNANRSRVGPDPTRSPNASGFTLQWNIG